MHPNLTPQLTCTKCGETKPATLEYFTHDRRHKNGFQSHCKACRNAQSRVWRESNKELIAERNRAYHAANRPRLLLRFKEYRQANRDAITKGIRKWLDANPHRRKHHGAVYRAAHPEQKRVEARRRRAQKRNAGGTHTPKDIHAQYERQKGKCYYCGVSVGDAYHVDHIVPISRGGSNGPENLVIACPPCNLSKRNKLPHEWPQGGRLL